MIMMMMMMMMMMMWNILEWIRVPGAAWWSECVCLRLIWVCLGAFAVFLDMLSPFESFYCMLSWVVLCSLHSKFEPLFFVLCVLNLSPWSCDRLSDEAKRAHANNIQCVWKDNVFESIEIRGTCSEPAFDGLKLLGWKKYVNRTCSAPART